MDVSSSLNNGPPYIATKDGLMKSLELIKSFSYPKKIKTTICKLSENNLLIARYLCLQYNDINDIQKEYIDIWHENSTENYITLESFNKHFRLESFPILEQYFKYCQNRISMDNFIEFVLFYVYFDFMMVFQVLLSCCGIFTNLAITEDQIIDFLQKCNIPNDTYLKEWIISLERDKERRVPIAGFFEEFHTTSKIVKPLRLIKEAIINRMITHQVYLTSLQRIYFYCNLAKKNETAVNLPPETCFDHLSRVLFTNRPHPYRCDFQPFTNEEKVEKVTRIVSTMRYRYGYSTRPLRATNSLRNSLKSTHSMHSARSDTNKKKANSLIIISDKIFDSKARKKGGSVCSLTQMNTTANTPDMNNRKMLIDFATPDKKSDVRKLSLDSCLDYDEGVPAKICDCENGSLKANDLADVFE